MSRTNGMRGVFRMEFADLDFADVASMRHKSEAFVSEILISCSIVVVAVSKVGKPFIRSCLCCIGT